MSAPERIWAWWDYDNDHRAINQWEDEPSNNPNAVYDHAAYIREDTVAETIRQAVLAERKACADVVTACAEALAQISEHPGVDTDGTRRAESMLRGIAAAIRTRGEV